MRGRPGRLGIVVAVCALRRRWIGSGVSGVADDCDGAKDHYTTYSDNGCAHGFCSGVHAENDLVQIIFGL